MIESKDGSQGLENSQKYDEKQEGSSELTPPRDPSEYRPDTHSLQQYIHRNVDAWVIEYLIREGDYYSVNDENRFVFRAELEDIRGCHKWVMPVQLLPDESKHVLASSPYIKGVDDDEMKWIVPHKPDDFVSHTE